MQPEKENNIIKSNRNDVEKLKKEKQAAFYTVWTGRYDVSLCVWMWLEFLAGS